LSVTSAQIVVGSTFIRVDALLCFRALMVGGILKWALSVCLSVWLSYVCRVSRHNWRTERRRKPITRV